MSQSDLDVIGRVPGSRPKADEQMYDEAMSGIKKHLIGRTKSGLMYTHELHPRQDAESKQLYVFLVKHRH